MAEAAGRLSGGGAPNVFTTLGRNPRLFRAWLRYSAHLMPFGRLPRRDTELVILRVAWRCRSAYEWHQHTPLALRAGLTPEQIAGVAGSPSADGFTPRLRTLLTATDEMLAQGELTDGTWTTVQAILHHREVIELCLLVGHYQGLSTAIGALGIQIEPDARGRA